MAKTARTSDRSSGRTPEQIERDRARSRAWHERQRAIVAQVQTQALNGASGRRPAGQPDADEGDRSRAPLRLNERAELEALRAEVLALRGKVAALEERVENDRQRSLRNNRRRRQRSAPRQMALSAGVPAPNRRGRHRAGSPPKPNELRTPPGSGGDLSVAEDFSTTTPGVQGGECRHQPVADIDAVWESPEVREAAALRPGIDLDLLRRKTSAWLADRPQMGHSVRLALSFIDRWQPPLTPQPTAIRAVVDGHAGDDQLAWVGDIEQFSKRQQQVLLGAGIPS